LGVEVESVIVPAVVMVHIPARTLGHVASGHGDCRCLAWQEALCADPLDGIASVGAIPHLDAAAIAGGTCEVLFAACARSR
jgi:hypothetical protein